jgi:hypothetical protein
MTSAFGQRAATISGVHSTNAIIRKAAKDSESLGDTDITSRTKNKFQNGFLAGVGSTSQFQGANQTLPIMPINSNNDLLQRVASSRGLGAGPALQPSWERSYAWAPGIGIDAYRSRITWTPEGAGLANPVSGTTAPITNAGVDRFSSGPIAPLQTYQLGDANTQAPVTVTGGEGVNWLAIIEKNGKSRAAKRQKGGKVA